MDIPVVLGLVRLQKFLGEFVHSDEILCEKGLDPHQVFFSFESGVFRYAEGTSQTSMFIRTYCARISTIHACRRESLVEGLVSRWVGTVASCAESALP